MSTAIKKWAIISLVLISLLFSSVATAQSGPLRLWYSLSPEDEAVLVRVTDMFGEEFGVAVEVQYMRPEQLFEATALAAERNTPGPDVIITDNYTLEPLMESGLIEPLPVEQPFFLDDLLINLPELVAERCGEDDPTACLWPRVSPTLPVIIPDDFAAQRSLEWICESSPRLVFCSGGMLPGVPVSWSFNLYLLNTEWMAEMGQRAFFTADEVAELRNQFGLEFLWAEPGMLPMVHEIDFPSVYVIPSALIVDDALGVMRSMGSFSEAGYIPVVELGVDGVFVSATAGDVDLARELAQFVAGNTDMKIGLFNSSQHLLAFSSIEMFGHGLDTPPVMTTLRAVMTLAAYANSAY